MTPARLAQIRSDLADMRRETARRRDCPTEVIEQGITEELAEALETEMARLDLLEDYLHTDESGYRWPHVFLERASFVGVGEFTPGSHATVRAATDSARERGKGEPR